MRVGTSTLKSDGGNYLADLRVKGLSCQIRLYRLVELICDALGYGFVADDWRNSDYYHLYSFNTAPFAWGLGTWQSTLPHWSLNEFFEQLERLMLCEFSWSNENVAAAGVVELTDIVDEFTATVTRDDESKYKCMRNIGYADAGHEMWNFYSCYWYFHKGARSVYSYDTLQELMTALRNVSASTGGRNSISAEGVYYAADVDNISFSMASSGKRPAAPARIMVTCMRPSIACCRSTPLATA